VGENNSMDRIELGIQFLAGLPALYMMVVTPRQHGSWIVGENSFVLAFYFRVGAVFICHGSKGQKTSSKEHLSRSVIRSDNFVRLLRAMFCFLRPIA
jgi:hypothetical protein